MHGHTIHSVDLAKRQSGRSRTARIGLRGGDSRPFARVLRCHVCACVLLLPAPTVEVKSWDAVFYFHARDTGEKSMFRIVFVGILLRDRCVDPCSVM